jgi:hypothetical protein
LPGVQLLIGRKYSVTGIARKSMFVYDPSTSTSYSFITNLMLMPHTLGTSMKKPTIEILIPAAIDLRSQSARR